MVDLGYLFEKFTKALLEYLMWLALKRVAISLLPVKVYQFSLPASDIVFARREASLDTLAKLVHTSHLLYLSRFFFLT